ncbi:MAG: methyltransferase domain-containing protein [Holosporales bacterium]|jgi:SAM-dependent methyltransferase|nr:methyltransferase domain-containing protein [Holosporales bacterium]
MSVKKGSPDRFGYEWNEYSEIIPIHEEQFHRWTPFLEPKDFDGTTFLDVGCGMGRNSYWPMQYGAKGGSAIDVNEKSLTQARRNLASYPAVSVEFMSADAIRYENMFDIVFSIGVIHHLEHPQRALQEMTKAAKPGGKVAIWVYGYENNEWVIRYINPLRKALFSRLPVTWTHFLSLFPAILLYIFLHLGGGRIEYLRLARSFSFRHLRSIVFDQMLPVIANYWTQEEVRALMEGAHLKNIRLQQVNDMSWAAIGEKG